MRVATFNVENLFSRVQRDEQRRPGKTTVVPRRGRGIATLDRATGLQRGRQAQNAGDSQRAQSNQHKRPILSPGNARRLYSNGKIVADGRADWIGSIEWRRDLIQAPAIENTGRIINEVKADVLCLVEVESRPVLRRFNGTILKEGPYPHAMLIDGNDERGSTSVCCAGRRSPTCAVMSMILIR